MIQELDNYYLSQEEPSKSCLLALRSIILDQDKYYRNAEVGNALLLLQEKDVLLFVDG